MGDSGSLFLGFIFTFIIIYTLQNNLLDLIAWIMLFSYFICDSSVTLIFRIIYRKNIFIAHIENFMLGCEHNTDNSIIYFDRKSIDEVDAMLNKLEYISDWHWSDIQEENWNKKCK